MSVSVHAERGSGGGARRMIYYAQVYSGKVCFWLCVWNAYALLATEALHGVWSPRESLHLKVLGGGI